MYLMIVYQKFTWLDINAFNVGTFNKYYELNINISLSLSLSLSLITFPMITYPHPRAAIPAQLL
jgi:hypothetical protein